MLPSPLSNDATRSIRSWPFSGQSRFGRLLEKVAMRLAGSSRVGGGDGICAPGHSIW
jgi:hypothetical protein